MRKILLLTSLLFSIVFAQAQTTYTWAVTSGDLDAPGSWTPSRATPAANDILVFDGSVQATATVTNITTRETIGQLLIKNNCAVTFSSATGTPGAGTVARSSATVTGTGTAFTTNFIAGDMVNLISASSEIATVTSATSLTTVSTGTVAAGSAYTICPRFTISGGANALSIASGSSLTISAALPIVLYVAAGSTGSISGALTFSGASHRLNVNDASGVTFNAGSMFTQSTGFAGNAFLGAGTANTVIFASGSTFNVSAGSNPFALIAPASKVVFNTGSKFVQYVGGPSFSGRTYGDIVLSTGNTQSVTGGSAVSINNLNVTANSTLTWGMTGTASVIKGNITVDAGSTLNFTGAGTTTLTGSTLQSISSVNAIGISSGSTLANGNTAGIALTPNTTVTVAGTLSLNGNPLTLKSSVAGTASIGAVTGTLSGATNVTAERYVYDRAAWRLVAPAVNSSQTINAAWQEGATGAGTNPNPGFGTQIIGPGGTGNGFDLTGTNSSLLVYNGTAFTNAGNTSLALNANPAYFLFSKGDRSINTTSGAHSATVLRSTGTLLSGSQGPVSIANGTNVFTLVANPYAAAVDFGSVTKNAVPNSFYEWDPTLGTYGGYALITGGVASAGNLNNIIPSGGAIMVQTDGTGVGSLTFTEASKAAAGNSTFGNFTVMANTTHLLKVGLNDAVAHPVDGVLAMFGDGYSNTVDSKDAPKLANFYENMSLVRSGKLLTLESRSDITTKDTIFITFSGMKAAGYQLQIDPSTFNKPGITATLEDAYLKTSTKLDMGQISNIAFNTTADTTSYKNRFSITFVAVSPVIAPISKISRAGAAVVAYPNPAAQKQINLSFDGLPAGSYNITVMNTFGQVMQKSSMTYNGTATNKLLNTDYSTGVYTVNIQSAGYNQSIKVIIP